MSNKNIFKLCVVIALATSAASAYGAPTTINSPLVIGGGTFSPSNKVTITYESGPDSTSASAYAARSKHSAGDRQVATNNQDPKMYYKKVDVTVACESSASTDVFTDASTWTSM